MMPRSIGNLFLVLEPSHKFKIQLELADEVSSIVFKYLVANISECAPTIARRQHTGILSPLGAREPSLKQTRKIDITALASASGLIAPPVIN